MAFDYPSTYPAIAANAPFLWHGGDYNPEQWSPDIWQDDYRLMKEAGVSVVSVGIFSWVSLQPAENVFTFEWLDAVLDGLHANGIKAILATPSAAQPAWMSQHYPAMLRSDDRGVRNAHALRVNYCPNSPDYRRLSGDIARRLAERYGQHPAVILWHISNEYGGRCLCETCAAQFRQWLQARYGTLENLNHRWWTPFWSHTYTDWSQITPPYSNGETLTHGLNLDYFRFMNESQLACYRNERDIIRAITPNIPTTTNLMGFYKPLDYRRWAQEMDVVAWDCYPNPNQSAGEIALMHDLMRGIKDGKPFLLMEQTPSSQNWQEINALKPPGVLRLWSYLAVAHGADSVLYFQWRRGRGGCEKLHGAVVEHAGRSDTRVFREVSQIGHELQQLGDVVIGARLEAKVGIIFDWDNWHALDDAVGPVRDKRYFHTVAQHYVAFYRRNIPVDVVFPDGDFSRYSILVAPMLYMLKEGFAEKVETFVARGGTFLTTHLSARVDETDLAFENGYPGPLQRVLGIWIEEIDAMYSGQTNTIVMSDGSGSFTCDHLADLIHAETADVLATYGSNFYQGSPVVTRNRFGSGSTYFVASAADSAFLDHLYGEILAHHGISAAYSTPSGVELTIRRKEEHDLIFVLNHNNQEVDVQLDDRHYRDLLTGQPIKGLFSMEAYGVRLLVAQE